VTSGGRATATAAPAEKTASLSNNPHGKGQHDDSPQVFSQLEGLVDDFDDFHVASFPKERMDAHLV
jgi:hypothetical protein